MQTSQTDINGVADGNRSRGIFKYEGRVYNNDHHHLGGYGTVALTRLILLTL